MFVNAFRPKSVGEFPGESLHCLLTIRNHASCPERRTGPRFRSGAQKLWSND